jgi:hypothetical protein
VTLDDLKTEMDRGFAECRQRFAGVDGEIGGLKSDVAVLKSDVAVLKSDVAVLKSDVALLKTDVAVLKTDVAGLKIDVAGLKIDVAALKTDVAGLRVQIAEEGATTRRHFDIAVEQFRTEVREAYGHIAPMMQAIAENKVEHGTIRSALDDHEIRIKAIEQRKR